MKRQITVISLICMAFISAYIMVNYTSLTKSKEELSYKGEIGLANTTRLELGERLIHYKDMLKITFYGFTYDNNAILSIQYFRDTPYLLTINEIGIYTLRFPNHTYRIFELDITAYGLNDNDNFIELRIKVM